MSLARPSYRYIHTVLSRSVNGCGDSNGVICRQELLYLYWIIHSEPLHLGHIVAEYLHYQSQYIRVRVLFVGLYITRLVVGMGLLKAISGAEKTIIPSPFGLETMRLMGMVKRYGPSTYVMIIPLLKEFESESDETEGSQPAPQP